MARPQVYARIRIESLEDMLGLYIAKQDHSAAEAIQWVARRAGVTLDPEKIAESIERNKHELDRWRNRQ